MSSPTSRTLDECRKRKWPACVVEKWLPKTNIRVDVWGFGDLLAIDDEPGSLLIQACVTGDAAKRVRKIREHCWANAQAWLRAGNRIQVWGWAKRGAAGKRKVWTLKVYDVELPEGNGLCHHG